MTAVLVPEESRAVDGYDRLYDRLDEFAAGCDGWGDTGLCPVPAGTALRVSKLLAKMSRNGLDAPEEMFVTSDGGVMLSWHDEDVSIMVAGNARAHISVSGVSVSDEAAVDTVTACGVLMGRPLHRRSRKR